MANVRNFLRKLSTHVVLSRRMPPDLGGQKLYVSPSASLRWWIRGVEASDPLLIHQARTLVNPGDIIWDLGANVGVFSFAAAQRAGKNGAVFAFEVDPWLCSLLQRSSEQLTAEHATVQTLCCAIGSEIDVKQLCYARFSRATNHLEDYRDIQTPAVTGGVRSSCPVVAINLDWLIERLPPPQVLKIDVEGGEYEVLKGARTLIREHRPVILSEINSTHAKEVTELLSDSGYRLFDASKPLSQETAVYQATYNTLALPEEHRLLPS